MGAVSIEVAAWDGAGALVDLSCACMFTHESDAPGPVGGLAHLDSAFDGALLDYRRSGLFRANYGETLLITRPPPSIQAGAILIIGLGDPENWSVAAMQGAVGIAVSTALARNARSAAFAASMLDGGIQPERTSGSLDHMVRGLSMALTLSRHLAHDRLGEPASLDRWVFDVGANRFDAVREAAQAMIVALG
jgi:hypothetical protein